MIHFEFVFLKLVTLLLGLVVATVAFRASRRHRSRPLLCVSIGFVFISVGAGLEGMLFHFTTVSLYQASLVHTGFMAVGIGWVLYSIYGGATLRTGTIDERDRAW